MSAAVTVAWSAISSGDTAVAADLSTDSESVTFPANSDAGATQTISIPITDDGLSETAETFSISLGADSGDESEIVWVKSTASSATATIAASDPITVSITGPTTVSEGDETSDYTVSLSGGTPTADLTVNYATADTPAEGTAKAGEDYTAKGGTLTFTPADYADKTFTVQTTEDILAENAEDFTVSISSPSGGGDPTPSLDAGNKSVTTTITDDDALLLSPSVPTDIELSVNPASVNEGDGETAFIVTATNNAGVTRAEAVTIQLVLTGSAMAGSGADYTAPAQASVTIPANQNSGTGTLTLTLIDDNLKEGDETIEVGGTSGDLNIGSALITVVDDDSPYLSISGPSDPVAEGGSATFTVTLSKSVAADVTVAWSAEAGTATAADYTANPGSVTFAANSAAGATRTIAIPITDDGLSETSETFSIRLGADSGDEADNVWISTVDGSAEATIAASDPITINISGPSTVDEGDETSDYTVSLSGGTPTADLTVNYATSNGTATGGTDYTAKIGTLRFAPTAAGPQTFTVQTLDDNIDEGTGETFTVTISGPSGGGGPDPILGSSTSVTTTINDDDESSQQPQGIAPQPTPTPTPVPGPTITPDPTPGPTSAPPPNAWADVVPAGHAYARAGGSPIAHTWADAGPVPHSHARAGYAVVAQAHAGTVVHAGSVAYAGVYAAAYAGSHGDAQAHSAPDGETRGHGSAGAHTQAHAQAHVQAHAGFYAGAAADP